MSARDDEPADDKQRQFDGARVGGDGTRLTTDQGVWVEHTDDSLTVGERGPTLIEDFHFREKITRFDHERIPERVVHARGAGAYGTFEAYESLADVTAADFLAEGGRCTPVFVRFSTVAGSRGSTDTVRDVRRFATKLYTREGNFDIVGNNMPVFFIQDGIKFPDFVHAVKPEPRNEIPQASSAHDTLWDFVALTPETTREVPHGGPGRTARRRFVAVPSRVSVQRGSNRPRGVGSEPARVRRQRSQISEDRDMIGILIAVLVAALVYAVCLALGLPAIVGIVAAILVLVGGVGTGGYGVGRHRGTRV